MCRSHIYNDASSLPSCLSSMFLPSERVRHRPGFHCVHRSSDRDAWLAGVGHIVLRHALQLGPLLHVWQHRGSPQPHPRAQTSAQVDP